jgi:hypothetical protein
MSEIITMPKFYSNREVAEILGVQPATVRQIKSRKAEQLQGLWRNDNEDGETVWSQEGLDKLAEFVNTDEAKQFRAGALTRRTQDAIAVSRSEISYQNNIDQSSTRTGHEVSSYEVKSPVAEGGRYHGLPARIGDAIASQMVDKGAIDEIDNAVVDGLLRALDMGDIDIKTLLNKS